MAAAELRMAVPGPGAPPAGRCRGVSLALAAGEPWPAWAEWPGASPKEGFSSDPQPLHAAALRLIRDGAWVLEVLGPARPLLPAAAFAWPFAGACGRSRCCVWGAQGSSAGPSGLGGTSATAGDAQHPQGLLRFAGQGAEDCLGPRKHPDLRGLCLRLI